MASFRSLRCEMNALGLLLLVYSMSVTGVSSATTTITATPIANGTSATPTQTTQEASIAPTATVTPSSSTANPTTVTQAPVIQPTSQPTSSRGREFDGASFIGGIILGIVLTGIFIFAFKWWQSRNKSYHSL